IAIPILFRLGWHPGFIKVKNLDVYLLGKAGLTTDIYSGDIDDIVERSPFTFSFGGNIGVKYFFTPKIGVFLEAGVNFYNLDHEAVAGSLHTDINNYVTLGVSITRDKKKKD
ncbi:MAG: hypothetical protein LBD22_03605, partial [Spirochaetaceae bacterium]|nr:hypothetical protein [Spirochaetaceae bacterium]